MALRLAALQRLADAEDSSLTNFVETALRRIVAEHRGKRGEEQVSQHVYAMVDGDRRRFSFQP